MKKISVAYPTEQFEALLESAHSTLLEERTTGQFGVDEALAVLPFVPPKPKKWEKNLIPPPLPPRRHNPPKPQQPVTFMQSQLQGSLKTLEVPKPSYGSTQPELKQDLGEMKKKFFN